ncbi:MAG: hypothetical protein HY276_11235 [Ignavibacteriales bacterium]|nr:hypothetical protein [Ignavibacteriales bacterium]MBI3788812.1 hypothetical protein [Ignavibacteriales bacterium]
MVARKLLQYVGMASVMMMLAGIVGCSKSDPLGSGGSTPVNLAVSFSKATASGLMKGFGVLGTDSLRIDSAIVVFQRIKFESHLDSAGVDSSGKDDDGREDEFVFKGPFVVHMRDTLAINFANQTLPAGTYDGIKFKIHRLQPNEHFEDSDDKNHHPRMRSDSLPTGSSIAVWGSVKKNGVWAPFTFKFDGEVEFKVKGNFTVSQSTNMVKIALNFDIGAWFRNPQTGGLLDPTDTSGMNRELFKRAIYISFGKGRGGHDRNDDGHPDD